MQSIKRARPSIQAFVMAGFLSLTLPLAAHDDEGGYQLLELDGAMVKWGEQELGVGASVSYALADEALRFDDARNCGDLAPISALSGQGLSGETLAHEAAAAFRVWERVSGLSFHEVADAREADIVIGAQGRPRGSAFANVSYAPGPDRDVRAIDQSLVCLNPEQEWKIGFDGNEDVYDIRYALTHEIGHAIGLDHPGPSGQVMAFRYTEAFDELQPGDLRGVRRLYGYGANDGGQIVGVKTRMTERSTDAYHARDLLGRPVVSTTEDVAVGAISDLIFAQDGGIVAVVVAIDGFLGIGEKNVALSWGSVELARNADETETVVRVAADADALNDAPEYEGASAFRTPQESEVDG